MKTKNFKPRWLVPLMGLGLVACGVAAVAAYVGLERRVHAAESLGTALDSLYQDQQLCWVLRKMHDGNVGEAAQRLDLVLCENILMVENMLASADEPTRSYAQWNFQRMARVRPRLAQGASDDPARPITADQFSAQRVLDASLPGGGAVD